MVLPIDLRGVDTPVLHRHLTEAVSQMYECKYEEDKLMIYKDKSIRIINELHRRWMLSEPWPTAKHK